LSRRSDDLLVFQATMAQSNAPRALAVDSEVRLKHDSDLFVTSWTAEKGFKPATPYSFQDREANLIISLMALTKWKRPTKKGPAVFGPWVAAEIHDDTIRERKRFLQTSQIRNIRILIADTIHTHNTKHSKSQDNKDYFASLTAADFEWWDRIKLGNPMNVVTPALARVELEYKLHRSWLADNKAIANVAAFLYSGVLANNPQDPPKDRVLAEDMYEVVVPVLEVSLRLFAATSHRPVNRMS
jgi:hypothetical protein